LKSNIEEFIPRIEYLKIVNYRALQNLELKKITPLTVFLGPNGSGKSTLFDVFAFLSECFSLGLRKAWDKRGRFKELRSRGSNGPIIIELKYRENMKMNVITYHISINENDQGPYLEEEWLRWRRKKNGRPFKFLDFKNGRGWVITGELPDEQDERVEEELETPEMLAVNTLGQLRRHPRVSALRRFITGWYLSYMNIEFARSTPEAGPQEHLSITGDNLSNVIQYLSERHIKIYNEILEKLSNRIPRLERIFSEKSIDNRLILRLKDAPFDEPILAKFASDGTLKMLAYLIMLHDPDPAPLIGIEEPENQLHHKLLPILADEFREASERSQIFVTTHSPVFINSIEPDELWILYRNEYGYTVAEKAIDINYIESMYEVGGKLGYLWLEDYFKKDNPVLSNINNKKV
jgi:predicted ATPase